MNDDSMNDQSSGDRLESEAPAGARSAAPYVVTVHGLPPEGGERVNLLGDRARYTTQEELATGLPDVDQAYREGRLGAAQRREFVSVTGPAVLVYRLETTPEEFARDFPHLIDQLEHRPPLLPGWRVLLELEVDQR